MLMQAYGMALARARIAPGHPAASDSARRPADAGEHLETGFHSREESLGAFEVPRAVFHPDDIGMVGKCRDGFGREIDAGDLREVIQQNGNLRLIGDRAEEQDLRLHAAHDGAVIVRRQYQPGLVAQLGGAIREPDRLADAFRARAGDQDFIGRRVLRRPLPHLDLFFRREVRSFPGRTRDQISGQAGAIPLFDVVLDFDLVQVAVVVEGGRDGGENTLELHVERAGQAIFPPAALQSG